MALSLRGGAGGDRTQSKKAFKWREWQTHRPRGTSVFWSERTNEKTSVTAVQGCRGGMQTTPGLFTGLFLPVRSWLGQDCGCGGSEK